jgi:hypothetical protein
MHIVTRPDSPTTRRTKSEVSLRSGMKSISVATPSSVSKRVSRISVSGRYFRLTRNFSVFGAIRQRPLSEVPSNAAKHASESNLGQHSQSIEPSREMSAAVSQSPIRA